jgi:hypothetical protein
MGLKNPKAHPFQVILQKLLQKPSTHQVRSVDTPKNKNLPCMSCEVLYASVPRRRVFKKTRALLGHTDAKMTGHYLDGHGKEKWQEVSADLTLNFR